MYASIENGASVHQIVACTICCCWIQAALKNAKDSKDGIGKEITSLQAAVEAAVGV